MTFKCAIVSGCKGFVRELATLRELPYVLLTGGGERKLQPFLFHQLRDSVGADRIVMTEYEHTDFAFFKDGECAENKCIAVLEVKFNHWNQPPSEWNRQWGRAIQQVQEFKRGESKIERYILHLIAQASHEDPKKIRKDFPTKKKIYVVDSKSKNGCGDGALRWLGETGDGVELIKLFENQKWEPTGRAKGRLHTGFKCDFHLGLYRVCEA